MYRSSRAICALKSSQVEHPFAQLVEIKDHICVNAASLPRHCRSRPPGTSAAKKRSTSFHVPPGVSYPPEALIVYLYTVLGRRLAFALVRQVGEQAQRQRLRHELAASLGRHLRELRGAQLCALVQEDVLVEDHHVQLLLELSDLVLLEQHAAEPEADVVLEADFGAASAGSCCAESLPRLVVAEPVAAP